MKARVIFEVYDDEDRLVHTETTPIQTILPIYESANMEEYEIGFKYCQLKDPIYIRQPAVCKGLQADTVILDEFLTEEETDGN